MALYYRNGSPYGIKDSTPGNNTEPPSPWDRIVFFIVAIALMCIAGFLGYWILELIS